MIKIVRNKIINSNGGKIFKYIDKNKSYFKKFGEIYVNILESKKNVDWIFHKKCQCLLLVIVGRIKFITKKKNKKKNIVILDSKKNQLVIIPPKTWFSFNSITSKSILLNLIDKPHDSKETIREKFN